MQNIDFKYIYSFGSLILVCIYLVILLYRKDLSKQMIVFSLVSLCFVSLTEHLFFKDYWYPPDILDYKILGIRIILWDILITIAAPSIMAVLYPLVFRLKTTPDLSHLKLFKYFFYLFISHLILITFYSLINIYFGVDSIFSWIIVCTIASIIMIKRRDLIKSYIFTLLASGFGTLIFYYIFQFFIGNEYLHSVWLLDHSKYSANILRINIPITEILFGALAGPFYCLIQPYLLKYKYIGINKSIKFQ